MDLTWIGAVLIIVGCGGIGFMMAMYDRRELADLEQLSCALEFMICELNYRVVPLPELCRLAGESSSGNIRKLFFDLCRELERQIAPDAQCCMNAAVSALEFSPVIKNLLRDLGRTVGRVDLRCQLRGLEAVRQEAVLALDKLTKNQDVRLRSYQTLGLCAGAALAILLL